MDKDKIFYFIFSAISASVFALFPALLIPPALMFWRSDREWDTAPKAGKSFKVSAIEFRFCGSSRHRLATSRKLRNQFRTFSL
jgi:hypothetical protein